MNPVWKTGTTVHALSDSGPSKTRVETSMNLIEPDRAYSLGNVLIPKQTTKKRRGGLTPLQQAAILLAMLFLMYLTW